MPEIDGAEKKEDEKTYCLVTHSGSKYYVKKKDYY